MSPFPVDPGVNVVEHPVKQAQVDALDHTHVVQRYMQAGLGLGAELAAAVAGQAEGLEPVAIGPIDRGQDVGAVARAADSDAEVAGRAVIHQLLDKDLVVTHVVAHGQDPAEVVGQAHDLEPLLALILQVLGLKRALAQVLADVGGRGARAAVAEDVDELLVLPGLVSQVGPGLDLLLVDALQLALQPLDVLIDTESGTQHDERSSLEEERKLNA
jgi:hypothetical protein